MDEIMRRTTETQTPHQDGPRKQIKNILLQRKIHRQVT